MGPGRYAPFLLFALGACGSSKSRAFDSSGGVGPGGEPAPPPGGFADAAAASDGGCTSSKAAPTAPGITIDPAFAAHYHAFELGQVPGMPQLKYGGVLLDAKDPDQLLIGANANEPDGAIYSVRVVRNDCKHIIGFAGLAQLVASAPSIDGGLIYGPNGTMMFAGWPSNTLGILAANGTAPAKTIDTASLGVPRALAAIGFVPAGFSGMGKFKLVSWDSGDWFDARIVMDTSGLPELEGVKKISKLGGGPEGFAYVPKGSPMFDTESMVVSEWSTARVAAYETGPDGDPKLETRRTLLSGLSGAEGAFFDPATGDFLFSTWNSNIPERVIIVTGFAPIKGPD